MPLTITDRGFFPDLWEFLADLEFGLFVFGADVFLCVFLGLWHYFNEETEGWPRG